MFRITVLTNVMTRARTSPSSVLSFKHFGSTIYTPADRAPFSSSTTAEKPNDKQTVAVAKPDNDLVPTSQVINTVYITLRESFMSEKGKTHVQSVMKLPYPKDLRNMDHVKDTYLVLHAYNQAQLLAPYRTIVSAQAQLNLKAAWAEQFKGRMPWLFRKILDPLLHPIGGYIREMEGIFCAAYDMGKAPRCEAEAISGTDDGFMINIKISNETKYILTIHFDSHAAGYRVRGFHVPSGQGEAHLKATRMCLQDISSVTSRGSAVVPSQEALLLTLQQFLWMANFGASRRPSKLQTVITWSSKSGPTSVGMRTIPKGSTAIFKAVKATHEPVTPSWIRTETLRGLSESQLARHDRKLNAPGLKGNRSPSHVGLDVSAMKLFEDLARFHPADAILRPSLGAGLKGTERTLGNAGAHSAKGMTPKTIKANKHDALPANIGSDCPAQAFTGNDKANKSPKVKQADGKSVLVKADKKGKKGKDAA